MDADCREEVRGHVLVLAGNNVGVVRQQRGRWEIEASLPNLHSRFIPRDLSGNAAAARSSLGRASGELLPVERNCAPSPTRMALACTESDAYLAPLTAADGGVRAAVRHHADFFKGAISPAIGKNSNGPSFYWLRQMPRSN